MAQEHKQPKKGSETEEVPEVAPEDSVQVANPLRRPHAR
jgi:hypothetical protein